MFLLRQKGLKGKEEKEAGFFLQKLQVVSLLHGRRARPWRHGVPGPSTTPCRACCSTRRPPTSPCLPETLAPSSLSLKNPLRNPNPNRHGRPAIPGVLATAVHRRVGQSLRLVVLCVHVQGIGEWGIESTPASSSSPRPAERADEARRRYAPPLASPLPLSQLG